MCEMFTESSLCAGHYFGGWGHNKKQRTDVKITPAKGHNRCKGPEQACTGQVGGTGRLDQSAGRGVGVRDEGKGVSRVEAGWKQGAMGGHRVILKAGRPRLAEDVGLEGEFRIQTEYLPGRGCPQPGRGL